MTSNNNSAPAYTRDSIWACNPNAVRGKPVHLGAHPQNNTFIYCNGRSLIIRDLKDPAIASEYTGHPFPITVARFSPSGFYVASGDERGFVRIFDPNHPDQLIKSEFQILSGEVNDLAWDFESKRLIAVGNGRDKFGHAFTFDSGNSVGEIAGHSKAAVTVAIRPIRPFRAATGSDDLSMNFYNGVPFKYAHASKEHARFLTCVRFSHDGNYLISTATDGKWVCYDGATGSKLHEVVNAHAGGIYGVSCSPKDHRMITSSGDGSVKLWDMATQQLLSTWTIGSGVSNQQLGNLWTNEWLLSVSLDGQLNYLDERTSDVARTVYGHQKPISCMTLNDKTSLVTGCFEGRLFKWDEDGSCIKLNGEGHSNKVIQLQSSSTSLVSIGMDNKLKNIDFEPFIVKETIPLPTLPTSLTIEQHRFVATSDGLMMDNELCTDLPVTVLASSDAWLARAHESKVYLHPLPWTNVPSHTLSPSHHLVSAMTFSSMYLAIGDSAGGIHVYNFQGELSFQWLGHTSRITSIQFYSSGQHAISASLDTTIRCWSIEKQKEPLVIKSAHVNGVTQVTFKPDSEDKKLISVGMDGCIKHWSIASLP